MLGFCLLTLGNHLKGGDESYPELIKRKYTASVCETTTLLRDPLMELVFEDMDEDDKGELPEIKEAITKRKCGLHTGGGLKRK